MEAHQGRDSRSEARCAAWQRDRPFVTADTHHGTIGGTRARRVSNTETWIQSVMLALEATLRG